MLEEALREYGKFVIPAVIAVFLVSFFVAGVTYDGDSGIFGVLGNIDVTEDADTQEHKVPDELLDMSQGIMPDVALKNMIFSAGTDIEFLSMFTITKDGISYDGTQQETGGFSITLTDVKNKYGNSVYTEMTKEDFDAAEELPWEMFYDKETGALYFINAGVYELDIVVQSTGASKGKFSVRIAVSPEKTP